MFTLPGAQRALEVTPVVVDGVMYVTSINRRIALDARIGREISALQPPAARAWPATRPAESIAASLCWATAFSWSPTMPICSRCIATTAAALGCRNGRFAPELRLDVRAAGGGRPCDRRCLGRRRGRSRPPQCLRGSHRRARLALLDHSRAGRTGSETWIGRAANTAAAQPGSPAPTIREANLVYWPIGNPCPDFNGDERKGDNLYTVPYSRWIRTPAS